MSAAPRSRARSSAPPASSPAHRDARPSTAAPMPTRCSGRWPASSALEPRRPPIAGVAVAFPGSMRLRDRRARISRRREVRRARRRGPARRSCAGARAARSCRSASATTPRRPIVAEALQGAGRPFAARARHHTAAPASGALPRGGDAIVERCAGVVPGELYRQPFGAGTADDAFSDRGLRARLGGADPAAPADASAVARLRRLRRRPGRLPGAVDRRPAGRCGRRLGRHRRRLRALRAGSRVGAGGGRAGRRAGRGRRLIGAARSLNGGVRRTAEPSTLNLG